jgi:imidazolonepropionase-like amidohydrolase
MSRHPIFVFFGGTRKEFRIIQSMVAGVALLLCSAMPANAQSSQVVAIHCGRLIDVRSEKPMVNATIIVRDGRIDSIGTDVAVPAGSQNIDLSHATCLPGLMDLHAHILFNPARGTDDNYLLGSSAYKALYGLKRAQQELSEGFTTLRDPSDFDKYFALVEIRDAIARGDFTGPRMFVAPHALTSTGGHADLNDIAPDVDTIAFGKIVSGPQSMREAVREEIKYGADWIKVYVSGGVMSAHDDPRVQTFTDEEIQAAVDETHRLRKKITVHAIGTDAIKESVRAGVDSVEHGLLIDDETIRMMKDKGTYLIPTLYVLNYIVEEGPKMGFPQASIDKGKAMIAERDRRLRAAFAAGVKICFGSDTIFDEQFVPREFPLLVSLGLTPFQAIQAATINPATLLGIDKETGTLEAGKQADIVAVEQNPLEDIHALEHVKFVMKGGTVVRNDF